MCVYINIYKIGLSIFTYNYITYVLHVLYINWL